MEKEKFLLILNFSLAGIALLLILFLLNVQLPAIGKTINSFDPTEPVCILSYQNENRIFPDLDRCCLEASKQLVCEKEAKTLLSTQVDYVCHTNHHLNYHLNKKAYNYCKSSPWQ